MLCFRIYTLQQHAATSVSHSHIHTVTTRCNFRVPFTYVIGLIMTLQRGRNTSVLLQCVAVLDVRVPTHCNNALESPCTSVLLQCVAVLDVSVTTHCNNAPQPETIHCNKMLQSLYPIRICERDQTFLQHHTATTFAATKHCSKPSHNLNSPFTYVRGLIRDMTRFCNIPLPQPFL